MADRAAPELQHDILAQKVQQLMHLPRVNAAGSDRHDCRQRGPVLLEIQSLG